MGRKKNVKISEQYALNWLNTAPSLDRYMFNLAGFINLVVITVATAYFMASLDMTNKLFTFIISGKVMGTDYILKFSDVCWIGAGIAALLLINSMYSFFKIAKNRNKIRLQITEAYPMSLKVRITA